RPAQPAGRWPTTRRSYAGRGPAPRPPRRPTTRPPPATARASAAVRAASGHGTPARGPRRDPAASALAPPPRRPSQALAGCSPPGKATPTLLKIWLGLALGCWPESGYPVPARLASGPADQAIGIVAAVELTRYKVPGRGECGAGIRG